MSYLGTGFQYPLDASSGSFKMVSDEESVAAAIRHLFNTERYARFMNPAFGSDLRFLLFEPCDDETAALLELYARDGIANFIPRIRNLAVSSELNIDENRIDIQISYSLITGPSSYTLVYPFYLSS